ncbi:Hypothetical predicted protein [Prunus dulcis]|uniref:Uncharacterized protein n=1 Tax=Prunus dulcis TaxID=3755 RepID=A0A5E4G508_PRUDU|nr:Hypothetical predicted protein [Prunus dulcis]
MMDKRIGRWFERSKAGVCGRATRFYRAFEDDLDGWMDGLSAPVWIWLRSKRLWLRKEQFSTVKFTD